MVIEGVKYNFNNGKCRVRVIDSEVLITVNNPLGTPRIGVAYINSDGDWVVRTAETLNTLGEILIPNLQFSPCPII